MQKVDPNYYVGYRESFGDEDAVNNRIDWARRDARRDLQDLFEEVAFRADRRSVGDPEREEAIQILKEAVNRTNVARMVPEELLQLTGLTRVGNQLASPGEKLASDQR
jgi:hypothetical protein